MFPLLHPTVDVSSISVPGWLSGSKNGQQNGSGPKLLRLLVVWPGQPRDLLTSLKLSMGPALVPCVDATSKRRSSTNIATGIIESRFKLKMNSSDHSSAVPSSSLSSPPGELSIENCLKVCNENLSFKIPHFIYNS